MRQKNDIISQFIYLQNDSDVAYIKHILIELLNVYRFIYFTSLITNIYLVSALTTSVKAIK